MKKKRLIVLTIALLVIVALIAVPRIIKSNQLRNEVRPVIEQWEARNSISGVSIKKVHKNGTHYFITLNWNDFEKLTPVEMRKVLEDFRYTDNYLYHFNDIYSNGNRYSINSDDVFSYKDMKRIVEFNNYSNYSSSSSSTPSKTATCNYCGGTGRVNGDKCPWCNGSGKTYDNAFNDALG